MTSWFYRLSLRRQLQLIIAIAVALPLLALLLNLLIGMRAEAQARREEQQELQVVARDLASTVLDQQALPPHSQWEERWRQVAAGVVGPGSPVQVGLWLPGAKEQATYGRLRRPGHWPVFPETALWPDQQALQHVLASGQGEQGESQGRGWDSIFFLEPVQREGQVVAVAWAAGRPNFLFARYSYLRSLSLLVVLAGLLLLLGGGLLVTGGLLQGVKRLKEGLGSLEQDLTYQLPPLPGELGEVGEAVNKMAAALREKESLEQELQRAERLAALGRLVAGVAHEIRNPLSIVRATAQVMQEEEGSGATLREDLGVILHQVDRQEQVIRDLLAFARPAPPRWAEVNLNAAVHSVLSFARGYLSQSGVRVALELAPDLPPAWGDGEKLKQVVLNLLFNAAQAMSQGGRLAVRSRRQNYNLVLSFQDSGPGLTPEQLAHIFDPFYTTKPQGTGLGLTISYQIAAQHGGRLVAANVPGGGAIFSLYLPLEGSDPPAATPAGD